MNVKSLYLLQTRPDARLLAAWIARHHARHEHQTMDLGDALHGLLRAAFGDQAPQPFRYLDEQQGLLAYTSIDAKSMAAQVALADPLAAQTLGLGATSDHGGYRLRGFPVHWAAGQVLGFEVRVRPTVRSTRGEQDVFLQAVSRADGGPVQRDLIYAQWLHNHLNGHDGAPRQAWHGAVELLNVQMTAWRRSSIIRRAQGSDDGPGRKLRSIDGPDAVLKGLIRVADSSAFAHLLTRGVGRHRSFGFGMLLLSRPN